MKKILALVAAMLCLVMILASCGNVKSANIDDYLNPDYIPEEVTLKTYNYISDLEGYTLSETNGRFAVFTKVTLPDLVLNPDAKAYTSYKLFSISAAKVIASFAGSNISCSFSFDGNAPIATVAKTTFNLTTGESIDTTYIAYDAAGNQLLSSSHVIPAAKSFADLVVFNYAAYSENEETGALTKVNDVSEFIALDTTVEYTDEFFYIEKDDEIIVYDRDFNLIAAWEAPSYANSYNANIMNDGNVLIQYTYELDSEATKYDFYEVEDGLTVKYDLVSLLFNPAKDTTKELKLDFIVAYLYSNNWLQRNQKEGNSKYSTDFENVASIIPIVDKKIDSSDNAQDRVIMDNKANVKKSLKIIDNQSNSGFKKVADDLYAISLKVGYALVNGDGEIVNVINNESLKLEADYIIGESAVYNYDLTIAYNLIENDASIMGTIDDSILVKSSRSNGYDIILLTEGQQKNIYSYTKQDIVPGVTNAVPTATVSFLFDEGNDFYCIHNSISGYSYYNAEGNLIISTQQPMVKVASYDNTVLLKGASALATDVYFTFTTK